MQTECAHERLLYDLLDHFYKDGVIDDDERRLLADCEANLNWLQAGISAALKARNAQRFCRRRIVISDPNAA